MYLSGLNDGLIRRFKGSDKTDPKVREIASFYNNLAYKEVYRSTDWHFRTKTGQLVIVPNYKTGTCSVTKYDGTNDTVARTVTFSGASLTSSMQGRYFSPEGSSNWYKIVYISGSTAYLEVPIVEDSASGINYQIWKRFYYLYSEVDAFLGFKKWGGSMTSKSPQLISDEVLNLASNSGSAEKYSLYGVDPYEGSYSTGSISIAKDSNVVTGVGTEWLSNASPGDVLTINNQNYRVKRVETDTRVILYNFVSEEVSAGTAYTLEKDSPMGFAFYPTEDAYRVLDYIYLARTYDMVHETKEKPLMPGDDFDEAIMTRAESMRMKDNDDDKWIATVNLYQSELDGLREKRHPVRTTYDQFAPKIPAGMGRG